MAAKKKSAVCGAAFPRLSCRHSKSLSTCGVMSVPRGAMAALRAIKEHASAGTTTRVEAFSVEIPQMVVFQKGSGTGNLQSHVVSKHRSAALTA